MADDNKENKGTEDTPEFNPRTIRVLHFEKLVPQNNIDSVPEKGKNSERIYRQFFCTGYYDRLSYVRAGEGEVFDYKHCFLIKYPYKQLPQYLEADQMMTLVNEDEIVQDENGRPEIKNDPFESDDSDLPFLGVILVTGYVTPFNADKIVPDSLYYGMLKNIKAKIIEICENLSQDKNLWNIFWTPNCSDLCVAFRTGNLNLIHELNKCINDIKIPVESDNSQCFRCHTLVYTMMIPPEKISFLSDKPDADRLQQLKETNRGITFELRIGGNSKKALLVRERLERSGSLKDFCGIMGVGEYSVTLAFDIFMDIYPVLWNMKNSEKIVSNFQPDSLAEFFLSVQQNLICPHLRIRYPIHKKSCQEKNDENRGKYTNYDIIPIYEKQINFLLDKVGEIKNIAARQLRERVVLIRELMYAYNDLLYKGSSYWKGIAFFVQIEALLNGTFTYLGYIFELEKRKSVDKAEEMTRKLYSNLNKSIACVNNFNKIMQSMNQYIVNIPNDEIQTKVNIEKYLMAYTRYLLEISVLYNQEDYGAEKVIIPLLTIDRSENNIKAYTFFDNDKDMHPSSREPRIVFFNILCPNYQWFSNIYHVLPMITHEISHNFRYLDRKERNEDVIQWIIYRMSMMFTEELIFIGAGHSIPDFYTERERFIADIICDKIFNACRDLLAKKLDKIHLHRMGYVLSQSIAKITGITQLEQGHGDTRELILEEVLSLMSQSQMDFFTPDIDYSQEPQWFKEQLPDCFKMNPFQWYWMCIWVNVFISVLSGDRDACEKWKEGIAKYKDNIAGSNVSTPDKIIQMLEVYLNKGKVLSSTITLMVECMETRWKLAMEAQYSDIIKDFCSDFLEKSLDDLYVCFAKKNWGEHIGDQQVYETRLHTFLKSFLEFMHHSRNVLTYIKWENLDEIRLSASSPNSTGDFLSIMETRLFEAFHKDFEEKTRHWGKFSNLWVTVAPNRTLLANLGVGERNKEFFSKVYRDMLRKFSTNSIKELVENMLGLYEEFFADIGMCEAFGFNAVGYFMYTIHISMKERNIPRGSLFNMVVDRMYLVFSTYYAAGADKAGAAKLLAMIADIDNAIQKFTDELSEDDPGAKGYSEMLSWIRILWDQLRPRLTRLAQWLDINIDTAGKYIMRTEVLMREHVAKVLQIMRGAKWIKAMKSERSVKAIGEYYNNFSQSYSERMRENGECIKQQIEFVFQYYGKFADSIYKTGLHMNDIDTDPQNISRYLIDGLYHAICPGRGTTDEDI